MRLKLVAILLGTLLCLVNHLGVIAGMADPPPGYQAAHYIRNLDVPQYITWMELAKTHWLLPNEHAPWQTEPALFQPLVVIAARSGLPVMASYYLMQLLMSWLAAYALLFAAQVFCRTRRAMAYAGLVILCMLPLRLIAWAIAKACGLSAIVQAVLAYGVVEYTYDTADGLVRGGLSNSFLLTFGTAMALFAFANLAKFLAGGEGRHYRWLVACVFVDGLFHPFEIFPIIVAAVWPLWKHGRKKECLALFAAAGVGMLPYLTQSLRSPWVRDISGMITWRMSSPVWVLLVYGLPAVLVCWLMLIRFRVERPEDEVLQSWFLCAAVLPVIPGMPSGIHTFDGFAYCVAFLLVSKAQGDKLMSRLFARHPGRMQAALAGWGLASALVLITLYAQVWKDGKSAHPEMLLSAVAPKEEFAMLGWMKEHLERGRLVLAPEDMAPWVAAIPMPSLGSHDVFSITYQAQRELANRFYKGEDVRGALIDAFGVSYVVAPAGLLRNPADGKLLHQEGGLRLYEISGERMKPYPGLANLAGAPPQGGLRHWVVRLLSLLHRPSRAPQAAQSARS